jgi:GH24 family phage-related lysozyme (muramidase)
MKIKHLYRDVLIETQIIQEYDFILGEVVRLFEDGGAQTFEWDLTKEKLDKSRSKITTKDQALKYLEVLIDKVKSLPEKVKVKVIRYSIMSMIAITGIQSVDDVVMEKIPELKHQVIDKIPTPEPKEVVKKEKVFKSPNKVSEDFVDYMKWEEGSVKQKGEPVLTAYDLGDGHITIGWGHAELKGKTKLKVGDKISYKKAEKLLRKDIKEAEKDLNRLLKQWKDKGVGFNVSQGMYDAMTSMIYNMGIGNFRGSDFIQLVKLGKYEQATERILTTNVTYPGHIPRRKKESEMFGSSLGGEMLAMNESGDFDWVEEIPESPNYQGKPQGVVYLKNHDEITEFFNILSTHGVLGKNSTDIKKTKKTFQQGLENVRDYGGDCISASFFISKKDPTRYETGYWDYDVDRSSVQDWLDSYGCKDEVVDCNNWKIYPDISDVRFLFSGLVSESHDFDWTSDIEPMKPEMEFLKDNFDNLQKVIKGDKTYYVDSERKPLFMYYQDEENGYVYVGYKRIWSVLEEDFGLKTTEIQELIKWWLEETYNLRGITRSFIDLAVRNSWKRPII